MNQVINDFLPPVLKRQLWKIKSKWIIIQSNRAKIAEEKGQDLEVYWDPSMADGLEQWGKGSVWDEIEYLLINCKGKVLDIACGPGGTMLTLEKYHDLEIHGVDISDLLINQAIKRGINSERLRVGDATKMSYADQSFKYGYSIGSLEHFTEQGILDMLGECKRVVSDATFHMIPVSRNNKNQGWLRLSQSYHNNSVEWWLDKYKNVYENVTVLPSKWEDSISVGKWFICKS